MSEPSDKKKPFPWRRYGLIIVIVLVIGRVLWLWPRTGWSLKSAEQDQVTITDIERAGLGTKEIRNVVLISMDTCRADHLRCYGYSRKTSPNIDAVAAEGVLFNHAVTPVPLTLPAHASMLTGNTPLRHGVRVNNNYRLGDSNITLAEILKEKGYTTAAAVSAFVLDSQFGLDQGFDTYEDNISKEDKRILSYVQRDGKEVTDIAENWLQKYKGEKFFLFLHYFDPHSPYIPHKEFSFSSPFVRVTRDFYDGEIAYTDHLIGRVVKKLKDLNLYESTMLIITSDHGEGLGQHKETTHGYFTYHSTLHVPLIIKAPGWPKGTVINRIVGLIDILPTICGCLGIDVPEQAEGIDLNTCFVERTAPAKERGLYFESLTPTKFGLAPFLGLVTNRFKYIHTAKPEVYDLLKNPDETRNLVKKQLQNTQIMQAQLKSILEEARVSSAADNKLALNEEATRRLKSLGYVASRSVDENVQFDQIGSDPKEFIQAYNILEKFFTLVPAKKFDEAKKMCSDLLAKRPDVTYLHFLLGQVALYKKDAEGMITHFSQYLANTPELESENLNSDMKVKSTHEFSLAHGSLATAFMVKGQYTKAIVHYKKCLFYNPYKAGIRSNLAGAYFNQGNFADALKHFNKALALDPNLPEAHAMVGYIFLDRGQIQKAVTHFKQALKISPLLQMAYKGLNKALQQKTLIEKNITSLEDALGKDPNQVQMHEKLGVMYYQLDDFKNAVYHWEKLLELNPNHTEALNKLAWAKATHANKSFYDPNQAIKLALRTCELTEYKNASALDTLSVAYAAAGKFDQAVKTAEKALNHALSEKQKDLAEEVQYHLQLFRDGQPYIQE